EGRGRELRGSAPRPISRRLFLPMVTSAGCAAGESDDCCALRLLVRRNRSGAPAPRDLLGSWRPCRGFLGIGGALAAEPIAAWRCEVCDATRGARGGIARWGGHPLG